MTLTKFTDPPEPPDAQPNAPEAGPRIFELTRSVSWTDKVNKNADETAYIKAYSEEQALSYAHDVDWTRGDVEEEDSYDSYPQEYSEPEVTSIYEENVDAEVLDVSSKKELVEFIEGKLMDIATLAKQRAVNNTKVAPTHWMYCHDIPGAAIESVTEIYDEYAPHVTAQQIYDLALEAEITLPQSWIADAIDGAPAREQERIAAAEEQKRKDEASRVAIQEAAAKDVTDLLECKAFLLALSDEDAKNSQKLALQAEFSASVWQRTLNGMRGDESNRYRKPKSAGA